MTTPENSGIDFIVGLSQSFSLSRIPGNEWALNQAKQNLVNNYFLVGVTEEMEDFINLLELSLPR